MYEITKTCELVSTGADFQEANVLNMWPIQKKRIALLKSLVLRLETMYVFIKYLKHFRVVGREENNVEGTGVVVRGDGEGEGE